MPGLAAIVRALNDLPKPAARLGRIQPVGVSRRTFEVIELPARKKRPTDIPLFALAIRGQNECSLARANQYSCLAHACSFQNSGDRY